MAYAEEIKKYLEMDNIRVSLDSREEKLSYKMRESQTKKIPYTLILGDKEMEEGLVSYRLHGTNETKALSKEEFVKLIKEQIQNKN